MKTKDWFGEQSDALAKRLVNRTRMLDTIPSADSLSIIADDLEDYLLRSYEIGVSDASANKLKTHRAMVVIAVVAGFFLRAILFS